MRPGQLRDKFRIIQIRDVDDGRGNVIRQEVELLTAAANIKFMRGGEAVFAGRLQARQAAILTIRTSELARQIDPADKAVNDRTGEVFNIRERPREAENRGYLEVLVESGVAT